MGSISTRNTPNCSDTRPPTLNHSPPTPMRAINQKLQGHNHPYHETNTYHTFWPGVESHKPEEEHEGEGGDEHAESWDTR